MASGLRGTDSRSNKDKNNVLKSKFGADNFNIIHINPGSFKNHLSEFTSIIANVNVSAVCVSETWFDKKHNSKLVSIPGFTLIRNDRKNKRGGGVAIYLKNNFKFQIVKKSIASSVCEFLFVEILFDNEKLLLGTFYNPPNNRDFTSLERNLLFYSVKYEHVIFAGDFNVDLLSTSKRSTDFFNIINNAKLKCMSSAPTNFVPNCKSTQIDLFLVKSESRLLDYSQFPFGSFTSHDLIFSTYQIDMSSEKYSQVVTYRSLHNIDAKSLTKRAFELDWDSIYQTPHIDDMVEIVTTNLRTLLDEFAPLKVRTVLHRHNEPKWMNNELRVLIDLRNFHHIASRSRCSLNRQEHKIKCKEYGREVTKLKTKLRYQAITPLLNDKITAKKLWQNFRSLGIIEDKSSSASNIDVEEINLHLGKVFTESHEVDILSLVQEIDNDDNNFQFSITTESAVDEIIKLVASNACGVDGLSIKFVKILSPFIIPFITHIVNCCVTQSYFPTNWKIANVLPIPKVSQPKDLDDYRPISILPCLSKILEKLLHGQLLLYLQSNSLLDSFQSGFRPFHSTNTALLKIHHDIYEELEKNRATMLVLLDFKKAFDLVPHHLLIAKLVQKFNLSRFAAKMIHSYLSDRSQRVSINNLNSSIVPVTSGVPQGGVLSTLLFSLFINDLPAHIRAKFPFANIHLYADDTQIYFHFDPTDCDFSVHLMNEILHHTQAWCAANEVLLNPSKTKALIICKNKINPSVDIVANNEVVEVCENVRNLGYIMNSKLTSEDHVKKVCNQVNATVAMLRQSQHLLPHSARSKLVAALVTPKILYCSNIYMDMNSAMRDKMKVAFNNAIRYVYKKKRKRNKSDSVAHKASEFLKTSNLRTFLSAHSCIFLHRLQRIQMPPYLFSLISCRPRLGILNQFKFKTTAARRDFFYAGPGLWNRLPAGVRSETSADKFRKECLSYFASVHD